MIRFGAIVSVVAVAIGLLVGGAVSGELTLVYISIGLAALALLMLIVGVAVWRDEVFGSPAASDSRAAGKDVAVAGLGGADTGVPVGAAAASRKEPLVVAGSVAGGSAAAGGVAGRAGDRPPAGASRGGPVRPQWRNRRLARPT